MVDCEKCYVKFDFFYFIKEEDYVEEEEDVVVFCDYVFCFEIEEGDDVWFGNFLDVVFVVKGDGMC